MVLNGVIAALKKRKKRKREKKEGGTRKINYISRPATLKYGFSDLIFVNRPVQTEKGNV